MSWWWWRRRRRQWLLWCTKLYFQHYSWHISFITNLQSCINEIVLPDPSVCQLWNLWLVLIQKIFILGWVVCCHFYYQFSNIFREKEHGNIKLILAVMWINFPLDEIVNHVTLWFVKVKVKLFLYFNWPPRHEGVLWSGGIAPLNLWPLH